MVHNPTVPTGKPLDLQTGNDVGFAYHTRTNIRQTSKTESAHFNSSDSNKQQGGDVDVNNQPSHTTVMS
jgi:hypothetical protein